MESTRPDLRPLGVGEIVDGAIRLYRTHFVTLITISAMVLGPIGLVEIAGAAAVGPFDFDSLLTVDPNAAPSEIFEPLIPIYSVFGLTALLSWLGSVLVQGASITALAQAYQGQASDWRTSLGAGLRRFLALIGATILVALGTASSFVALVVATALSVAAAGPIGVLLLVPLGLAAVILAVFLLIRWTVTPAVVIAEQAGPAAAMGRSYRLVKGRFWPVLGAVILAYLLYFVVSQIVGTVTGIITFGGAAGGSEVSFLPVVVSSAVVSIVSAPFLAAMITIIYFDLRVRKEGYDLELMARDLERMEGRAGPPAPPPDDDPFGLGDPGRG